MKAPKRRDHRTRRLRTKHRETEHRPADPGRRALAARLHPAGLSRGEVLELEVEGMALDGDAVARVDGFAVLLSGAIPGERVAARLVELKRKFARAEVLRILRPSPHRVEPRCRHFGVCGGCAWQHIAYREQLRLKQSMLQSALERALGGEPLTVLPALGIASGAASTGEAPYGFRNKVHFVLGRQAGGRGLAMGHYRRGSRELIEVEECPVHSEAGNRIAFAVREALRRLGIIGCEEHEAAPRGLARHLVVRVAESGGDTQATLVVTGAGAVARKPLAEAIAASELAPTSLHLNVHPDPGPFIFGRRTERLYGPERLRERIAGAEFRISPRSFFQTCARPAELLVQTVLAWIPARESRPILDLYAGAGLFALPLARRGQRVIAVEENPESIGDGIASRRAGRIPDERCRFVRGRVEEALKEIAALEGHGTTPRFGAVILDPPREGCPPEVWRRITRDLRPPRVIYVSCNPRALANDLALARRGGWRIARVQPVDMFPHTAHIECVALLERAAAGKRKERATG